MRQTDLKRLIAFSSISHMGFVLLGLSSVVGVVGSVSPIGLAGASLQMFTHGTITGLMFLVVGFIYEKVHTRYIPDLGGLATRMPILASALLIAGLASLGLPLTSGFVSEIMVFLGAFPVSPCLAPSLPVSPCLSLPVSHCLSRNGPKTILFLEHFLSPPVSPCLSPPSDPPKARFCL